MELINLFINESLEDRSGVSAIALVDSPAIEEGWLAFSKQNPNLKYYNLQLGSNKGNFVPVNGDQQIISGPLMIPNKKIYRKEGDREFEVIFTPETIKGIQEKFALSNINTSINEMHKGKIPVPGGLIQHFIIDRKQGIMPPFGKENLEDGTWYGYIKVKDLMVWVDYIKTGIYTGFSVEGFFYEEPAKTEPIPEENEMLSNLWDALIDAGFKPIT